METRVWIRKRRCQPRHGRAVTTYHLRWQCPTERRWKSRKVGTDGKRAQAQAAKLEGELSDGSYTSVKRITWSAFVDDHVAKLRARGKRNGDSANCALVQFGKMFNPSRPSSVTYSMIEAFVTRMEEDEAAPATVNQKLTYLQGAFMKAIKRGYAAKNPVDRALFKSVEDTPPRILTDDEETAVLDAAEELFGYRWRAFVVVALGTGGRRSELLGLTWDRIRLDGNEPQVHFTDTKSHRDRIVPINPDVVDALRRVRVQTMQAVGPFVGMDKPMQRRWDKLIDTAGVARFTPHDLRRTYVTRLIRANVSLPTVQKLAGHADIKTTLRFYNWVSMDDMRAGVARIRRAVAG